MRLLLRTQAALLEDPRLQQAEQEGARLRQGLGGFPTGGYPVGVEG